MRTSRMLYILCWICLVIGINGGIIQNTALIMSSFITIPTTLIIAIIYGINERIYDKVENIENMIKELKE